MASSSVIGLLRVLLSANAAEFDTVMKRSADSAAAWSKQLKNVGMQATQVGAALTKTFTLPLVAGFASSAKAAASFESSFAGVRKTVQATEPEFAQMATALRGLAKTIPINVNELNRLAEAAGAMGIPKAEIVDFTRVMALLGVTTNVTSEQAAESIGKIQNIFGAAGKDTERFASTLVALGNDGASTESQILEMATRIAGAGNTIGMTQGQVLAFASALSSVGIEAEMGGSAISRVFIDIAGAVSQGGKRLEDFARVAGKPIQEFARLFKEDAAAAVNAFIVGLGRIKDSGGDLLGTLRDLDLNEIRVRDTLLRTAGAGDLLTRALDLQKKAWSDNAALSKEAAERFKTTEAQLTLLWNRIKDVGITLGNALLPSIKGATDAIGKLLPLIDGLAKGFGALPSSIQMVAVALGVVVAAAGPAIFAFGQLALSGRALSQLFTKDGLGTQLLVANFATLRSSAATTLAKLAEIGVAARTSGVLMAGFSAAVAGIVVPAAIIILSQRIKEIQENAQKLEDASLIAKRFITNIAEADRILKATQAGAQGLPVRGAISPQAITTDEANAWLKAKGAAEAYEGQVVKVNTAINDARASGRAFAGMTLEQAKAIQDATGAAAKYAGGVLTIGTSAADTKGKIDPLLAAQAALARADFDYTMALKGKRDVLAYVIKNMDALGATIESIAKDYGVSEQVVKRYKQELEDSAEASKKAETAAQRQAREAEKAAKAIEKQRDALEKLGVVTRGGVIDALDEFSQLVQLATSAGVPLNRVLAALVPGLEELRDKAVRSGAGVREASDALEIAQRAAAALNEEVKALVPALPPLQSGLSELPGIVTDMSEAAILGRINTDRLIEAYQTLGLKTPAELRKTAIAAIAAFKLIKESGTATPKQIEAAFEEMRRAVEASTGKMAFNLGKALREGLKADFLQVPGILANAVATGNFKSAVIQIGSNIGATIGAGIGQAFGGPVGASIGQAIGSLLGPLLGKLFKSESRHINDLRDDFLKSFGRAGTGIGSGFQNIANQLRSLGAEGQALFDRLMHANNTEAWEAAVDDVTAALKRQRDELSRVAAEGGLASKELIKFRDATKDTAETLAFIRNQTEAAGSGFSNFAQLGAQAYDKLHDLREKFKTASGSEREQLAREIQAQEALIKAVGVTSQESAAAIGAAFAGTFAALQEQGLSVRQILEQMGPGIEAFKKQLEATGFSGGAAFDYIQRLAELAAGEISGPALDAIHQLTQGLVAAQNAGFLTQDMFGGIVKQILASRQALLDQGATAEEVQTLMAKDLQKVWQLQQDFGFEVDETTQALIDQALEAGKIGDKFRDPMDRAARAMEKVATLLEGLAKKAGIFKDALEDVPDEIVVRGRVEFPTTPFDDFERQAREATDSVQEGVDGISYGRSPGGLKDIPPHFEAAATAAQDFGRTFNTALGGASGVLDDATLKASGFTQELAAVQLPPNFEGDIRTAVNGIGSLAGTTGAVVDGALVSVDSLRVGVGGLSTEAQAASGAVAGTGQAITSVFDLASIRARDVQLDIRDTSITMDDLKAAILAQPWQQWADLANASIGSVRQSLEALIQQIVRANQLIVNLPQPGTGGKGGPVINTIPGTGGGGLPPPTPGRQWPMPDYIPKTSLPALPANMFQVAMAGVQAADLSMRAVTAIPQTDANAGPRVASLTFEDGSIVVNNPQMDSPTRVKQLARQIATEIRRDPEVAIDWQRLPAPVGAGIQR